MQLFLQRRNPYRQRTHRLSQLLDISILRGRRNLRLNLDTSNRLQQHNQKTTRQESTE
jgi:hypothetical protein